LGPWRRHYEADEQRRISRRRADGARTESPGDTGKWPRSDDVDQYDLVESTDGPCVTRLDSRPSSLINRPVLSSHICTAPAFSNLPSARFPADVRRREVRTTYKQTKPPS